MHAGHLRMATRASVGSGSDGKSSGRGVSDSITGAWLARLRGEMEEEAGGALDHGETEGMVRCVTCQRPAHSHHIMDAYGQLLLLLLLPVNARVGKHW